MSESKTPDGLNKDTAIICPHGIQYNLCPSIACQTRFKAHKFDDVVKENSRLCQERDQLKAESVTFRNAQKACEDCDGPTMEEVRQLNAERDAQYEENVHRIAEQAKAENERDQLKEDIAALSDSRINLKQSRDQWREVAQDLAQELIDNLAPDLESPALERYNKLKEGK